MANKWASDSKQGRRSFVILGDPQRSHRTRLKAVPKLFARRYRAGPTLLSLLKERKDLDATRSSFVGNLPEGSRAVVMSASGQTFAGRIPPRCNMGRGSAGDAFVVHRRVVHWARCRGQSQPCMNRSLKSRRSNQLATFCSVRVCTTCEQSRGATAEGHFGGEAQERPISTPTSCSTHLSTCRRPTNSTDSKLNLAQRWSPHILDAPLPQSLISTRSSWQLKSSCLPEKHLLGPNL